MGGLYPAQFTSRSQSPENSVCLFIVHDIPVFTFCSHPHCEERFSIAVYAQPTQTDNFRLLPLFRRLNLKTESPDSNKIVRLFKSRV